MKAFYVIEYQKRGFPEWTPLMGNYFTLKQVRYIIKNDYKRNLDYLRIVKYQPKVVK